MKLFIFTAIGGALLLSGCAGTSSEFECNATTSDTCMTMHQANDKAKLKEEGDTVKADAGALPRLADGNFSSASNSAPATSMPLPTPSVQRVAHVPFTAKPIAPAPLTSVSVKPASQPYITPVSTPVVSTEYPRPLRVGERTAQLWIAPYIDKADVYHQPSNVVFVVTSSHWGKPRIR
ncbi:MAG: type IV conjugative transfer system lipoprotein TraV [Staphylococcus epidermidis]|nr:type IV conjugative transfer system lipoprotein TraV [Staphylococcus epidermidis]